MARRNKDSYERIREAALDLFARQGYVATGIRDIAREAGITSSTLYHHVSNKEELLVALMREAFEMLAALQGRTHQVITGVCLVHLRGHRERLFAEITEVRFRSLDEAAIRRYLERVNPLDKAGAYAIQEHGDWIIEEITGSFTNVVGLPVERLQAEFEAWSRVGQVPGSRADGVRS